MRNVALLAGVVGLVSLAPVGVDAAGADTPRVVVAPSHDVSGLEDTEAIQQALAACASAGNGCTVQLMAGTYYIKEITAFGFQGRLRGRGKGRTVLEVVPPLARSQVFVFVGGNVDVSDLTLRAPDAPGTATSSGDPALLGVVFVRDGSTNRFALDSVRMETGTLGVPVYVPNQPTMHIGVWYAGPPTGGALRVKACSFENVPFLLGNDPAAGARITFSHNRISRYYFGVQIFNLYGGQLTVAHNVAREAQVAWGAGYFLVAENDQPSSVPTPTVVDVHNNDIDVAGLTGFIFSDNPDPGTPKTLRVAVRQNRVVASEVFFGAIASDRVDGIKIIRNAIAGTGSNAISLGWGGFSPTLFESTDGGGQIVHNDVGDFLVTMPGPLGYAVSPVWLGPQSHHTRVITDEPGLVLDEGVENRVIGK